MMYLHQSANKDDYTWHDSEIMCENHKFITGPKKARGSGMVYYL